MHVVKIKHQHKLYVCNSYIIVTWIQYDTLFTQHINYNITKHELASWISIHIYIFSACFGPYGLKSLNIFVLACNKCIKNLYFLVRSYLQFIHDIYDRLLIKLSTSVGLKHGILPIYREVLELCCNVLEKLLDASGPVTVFQRYREEILKGLSHPQITVKCLCLRQVSFSSSGTASFFLFT